MQYCNTFSYLFLMIILKNSMLFFHLYQSANITTSHQSFVRAQAKSNMKCNLIGPRRFSFFKHVRGKHLMPIQGNCKGCCKWTTLQTSKKGNFYHCIYLSTMFTFQIYYQVKSRERAPQEKRLQTSFTMNISNSSFALISVMWSRVHITPYP